MQVGDGPQHREFRKEILQAMQVGVWAPTQRIHFIEFYSNVQVGVWAPTQRIHFIEFYSNVQVGVGRRNKFCENIISVPLPYA